MNNNLNNAITWGMLAFAAAVLIWAFTSGVKEVPLDTPAATTEEQPNDDSSSSNPSSSGLTPNEELRRNLQPN